MKKKNVYKIGTVLLAIAFLIPMGMVTAQPEPVDPPAGEKAAIGYPGLKQPALIFKSPPPTIVSARSGRDHGGTMYWIALDADPDHVEPRMGGVQKIEFTLSGPVIDVQADVSCAVGTYSGTITVTVSGDDLIVTVEFDPALPDQDCCTITLSGDVSDSFLVRTLEGDVNFDKSVSSADASSIKGRLEWLVVDHPDACQYDVNYDGAISSADISSVKGRLERVSPC